MSDALVHKAGRVVSLQKELEVNNLDDVLSGIRSGKLKVEVDGKYVSQEVAVFLAEQLAKDTAASSHSEPSRQGTGRPGT